MIELLSYLFVLEIEVSYYFYLLLIILYLICSMYSYCFCITNYSQIAIVSMSLLYRLLHFVSLIVAYASCCLLSNPHCGELVCCNLVCALVSVLVSVRSLLLIPLLLW